MPKVSAISAIFPPAPPFTDRQLPSLVGKVYIITGAASGVGYELAKIVYLAGGKVYIAARSTARCQGAIEKLVGETRSLTNSSKKLGKLESMVIDLSDLRTVKPAAEDFLKKEQRLDVLLHNAAVMTPPLGSKDKLGHDLEIGTNCLAPYLLTMLLSPLLIRTSQLPDTPKSSVRIVWVVSLMQFGAGGMTFQADGSPAILTKGMDNYMQTKVGDAWLAAKFADELGKHGILSVSIHPGLMKTELQRNWPIVIRLLMKTFFKGPVYGAYSELYAGFSPEVTAKNNGGYLMAWGRHADLLDDTLAGLKSEKEGGTGAAAKFFSYCDREIKNYL